VVPPFFFFWGPITKSPSKTPLFILSTPKFSPNSFYLGHKPHYPALTAKFLDHSRFKDYRYPEVFSFPLDFSLLCAGFFLTFPLAPPNPIEVKFGTWSYQSYSPSCGLFTCTSFPLAKSVCRPRPLSQLLFLISFQNLGQNQGPMNTWFCVAFDLCLPRYAPFFYSYFSSTLTLPAELP